ncbi:hypothetical protein L227DRAFT_497439 [Lentinus tigrinus ALCF2SS1-6]|uniref:G protein-coupled receptor 89 n=1 Tax=Lentinus tigrinus ALCF2SS1-6 TaxID=1328759 RepID=A0A5C2SHS0_9APHY|nr:hypothetical protein L227DRAFT_497439 [Lentinus tigrinus ALCF2SS1-6]
MSSSASASVYGLESAILVGYRAVLFYASRRYLLRHLYYDLQDLSAKTTSTSSAAEPGTPAVVFDSGETELELLPTPSSASTTPTVLRKRPIHSALSRALFSLCFSESCTLFFLLICQGMEIFHPRVRLLNWEVSLCILVIAIVLVIPLSYSLVLSYRSNAPGIPSSRQRTLSMSLLLYLIPNFLFLLALSYVPLPTGMPAHNMMASTLSRLTVIGTVILGALSGFGAIDTAWAFFPVFSGKSRAHPTDEEVRTAEAGLQRVREDLARRRKELQTLEAAKKDDGQSSHWLYRALPTFQGSSEASSLGQELSGLEALEYEMSRKMDVLKQRQADAKFSKTVAGYLFNWGGRVFAVYCVYRILSSIVSLIFPRSPPSAPGESGSTSADVVSVVLAYMVSFLPLVNVAQDKVAVISRQISLALVGVIILSSIRRVLRGVASILRVTSRSLGASLMLLTLAQVMGIYLLSTLIQLRTSFPPPPTHPGTEPDVGIVNLFSTLPEYQFFGSLFDGAFLLAAGASAVVRWFGDRVTA